METLKAIVHRAIASNEKCRLIQTSGIDKSRYKGKIEAYKNVLHWIDNYCTEEHE